MDIEKVGQTIAYLRKRVGYTQKELADRIGISDKAVSKWERGLGLPEISYLRKLSILLDTDSDSLLAGNIAHHNTGWQGVLILENNDSVRAETIIYDKPLVYFLLSYFLLVGIKRISIICNDYNRLYIERSLGNGEDYGINLNCYSSIKSITAESETSLMILYGRTILYGVDQTRFFQKAMIERNRITILALPKKAETIHVSLDMKVLDPNESEKLRTQYDYCRIPFLFMPSKYLKEMSETSDIISFINQHETYVEMLDRGFVEFEVNNWNDVQDASVFMRIIQNRCGMNVYCLEEVAWRRGFISLEQLKLLGEKNKNTEYGDYILSLYNRMKS